MTLQATTYTKPLPEITRRSKPFWDACKAHKLIVQRCEQCSRYHMPAADLCPQCGSGLSWVPASGRGTIYTYTVFHVAYHPAFKDDLPYNVSIIELEEGPFLISNVVNCAAEDVKIGLPVKVLFRDVTENETLPLFEPA